MSDSDWVVDVSLYPHVCFVPYDDGDIMLGMSLITEHCPGNLIGVIHSGGQEAVEEWIAAYPDWKQTYQKEVADDPH